MNTCKTCQHSDIVAINAMIGAKVPVRTIAIKYPDLSTAGITRHKMKCVTDLFEEFKEQLRAGLLAKVDRVEKEIVAVRKKFEDNPNVRIGLIGKMLDSIEKEARLTGAYQQDAKNKTDIERVAASYRHFCEMFPNASENDRSTWLDIYARESGLDRAAIMKQVREQIQDISEAVQ